MTTTEIEVNVREEVKRGAEWLDEVMPNWEDKIDLAHLDTHSCERCIVGQLWGYGGPGPAEHYDADFGFDVNDDLSRSAHAQLTEEWRDLIASRR